MPGEDAIVARTVQLPDADTLTQEELAQRLLERLLADKPDAGVRAPMPGGTTLLSLSVLGNWARVDFSRQYARLAGIDLTLADYCVTLTLTQLDGCLLYTSLGAVHNAADRAARGKGINGGNVGVLERRFAAEGLDGVVRHAVADDNKIFHRSASLRCVYETGIRAGTAVQAGTGVDLILGIALRDRTNGASVRASTAANAGRTDVIGHKSTSI